MSDAVMVQGLLDKAATEYPSGLSKDELFEFFCADKLLTNYDVTYDEIAGGIVDGSGDGGVDATYLFVDRRLVKSDFNLATVGENPLVELIVIQSNGLHPFGETGKFRDRWFLGRALAAVRRPRFDRLRTPWVIGSRGLSAGGSDCIPLR